MTDSQPGLPVSSESVRGRHAVAAWLVPFTLIGVTLVAFAPAFLGQFVEWDDQQLIRANPLLQPGSGWAFLVTWTRPFEGLFAPLTYTVYAGVAAFSRTVSTPLNPLLFHAVMIALHGLAGLLVYQLLVRLGTGRLSGMAGALVWLVHPMQVESVAWASSLNTVLSGLFAIAAFLLEVTGITDRSARRRHVLLSLGGVALALSFSAKPACLMLPLALIGINRWLLDRPWRETLTLAGAWFAIAVPFVWIARSAQQFGMIELPPPVMERFLIAGHALGFYILKILWPFGLAIDYGMSPAAVLASPLLKSYGLIAVALVLSVIGIRRRLPWTAAALSIFVAGVLPVLGFVPFYFQTNSTVADRYVYFSLLGPAVAIAFGLRSLEQRNGRWAFAASIVLVAGLATRTFAQSRVWHDSRTLFKNAIAVNPTSVSAQGVLGIFAQSDGDLTRAEKYYHFVLDRRPDDGGIRYNLANLLMKTNRLPEAVTQYQHIVADNPSNEAAFNNLGIAEAMLGNADAALRAFQAAIAANPRSSEAYANAGAIFRRSGDREKARACFENALQLNPSQPKAINGLKLLESGR